MNVKHPALAMLALVAVLAAACDQSAVSPSILSTGPSSPSSPSTSAAPSSSIAAGPLPVIIDTDLAGDDIFGLLTVIRNEALDVRAVTIAATGEVHCVPGIRNGRRLLAALGRPEIPVACGSENPGPNGRWFPPEWRQGADDFYGLELPAVNGETNRDETAPELLVRLAAASEQPLTLLTLGPFTNVADAAALDPSFASRLAGIHAMAGTIDAPGNISYGDTSPSDGVEWNVGADPDALAAVLALDVPITLVGLDATNDVPVPEDIVATLESDHAAAGADIAYEMYARTPFLADGSSSYWDPLAAITLTDPSIATWEDVSVTMTPSGPGAGRLARSDGGRPVRVAMSADRDAFMTAFLAALRTGAPRAKPFTLGGSMSVRWDGTSCQFTGDRPSKAGLTSVLLINESDAPVALQFGGAKAPKTWADLLAFVDQADIANPDLVVPDWLVQIPANVTAEARSTVSGFVSLPAGDLGAVCATGEWPDLTFHDAGAFSTGS